MKKRKSGKRTRSVASYCTVCHNMDQKVREARRYLKKLAYNREWRKRNRLRVNAGKRKAYRKSVYSSTEYVTQTPLREQTRVERAWYPSNV